MKFAAVDHRGGQRPAVDHRAGKRAPGGAGRALEQFGGVVAEEFEGVATFDQALALVDQPLEFDRLDLGAVLFGLRAALRLLVAVELGLDAADLAVEEVDERPEEIGEIVLESVPVSIASSASTAASIWRQAVSGSGSGRGSGSSWPGRWP